MYLRDAVGRSEISYGKSPGKLHIKWNHDTKNDVDLMYMKSKKFWIKNRNKVNYRNLTKNEQIKKNIAALFRASKTNNWNG